MPADPVIREKLDQVPGILRELDLDAWLILVRESHTVHDPCLDLVLGTNVTWPAAFILGAAGERLAIVGHLDRTNIEMQELFSTIESYAGGIAHSLRAALARLDPRWIAINYSVDDPLADGLTHGLYRLLQRVLEGTPYAQRLVSSESLVRALRGRKSAAERERIRAACRATQEIFARLTPWLRPGLTEREIAARIREEMARTASLAPAWDPAHCPAVFTGPESAGAHAAPTDRPVVPGDLMNVDFGVRLEGYCSDLQRTWYFLREDERVPPEPVRRGFATIVEAIQQAAAAMRPGVKGVEVDAVARELLKSRGYPEFPHGLGHQVGRAVHDGGAGLLPRWERYGALPELPLEAGQCFTIEPRLPVEGHGIATCEEIVVVTDRGCEFLSDPQRELYVVPPHRATR